MFYSRSEDKSKKWPIVSPSPPPVYDYLLCPISNQKLKTDIEDI